MAMEPAKKFSPAEVKQAVADYFKDHNISMADAGLKMGMSRASVSYALSVTDKYFKLFQALKYSAVFGMSTEFLTKGEGELIPPLGKDYAVAASAAGKVSLGVYTSEAWEKERLAHEEKRYNKALSDLSDLDTLLQLVSQTIHRRNMICHKMERENTEGSSAEETIIRLRQSISECEKARAYVLERQSTVRRIISDIEEKKSRREHPELWEKADEIRGKRGADFSQMLLFENELGIVEDEVLDWDGQEEK